MNEQREKLIELIGKVSIKYYNGIVKNSFMGYLADCIIADGWIRPPCKVGQTVYVVNSLWVSEYTVEAVWWDGLMFQFKAENEEYADECSVFYFFDERIGKTVFLSREDAEKALEALHQPQTKLAPTETTTKSTTENIDD